MSALTAAIEHVFYRLADDGVTSLVNGRVYQGVVPDVTDYPVVLVQSYGDSMDLLGIGRPAAGSNVELLVRVVAPATSLAAIEDIHDAVMESLHGSFGTNSRGDVSSCVRTSETEMTAIEDIGTVRYLDSRYRLLLNEQLNV